MATNSLKTSESFAKEVAKMSDEEKLFLSILAITGPVNLNDFVSYYNHLKKKLKRVSKLNVENLIKWSSYDKVEIMEYEYLYEPYLIIAFKDKIYLRALNLILQNDRKFLTYFILCLKFFTKNEVLLGQVSRALNDTYHYLPVRFREKLLLELSIFNECLDETIPVFIKTFSRLPIDIRNEILRILSGYKGRFLRDLFILVNDNYRKIPNDIKRDYWINIQGYDAGSEFSNYYQE